MIGECTLCFRGIRIDFVFYTAFACGAHKLLDMKRRFCYFDAKRCIFDQNFKLLTL